MTETWEYGEAADPGGDGATPDPVASFPWPPAEGDSALTSFVETWRRSTFEPSAFFARVPRSDGTGAALAYYLVVVVLVAGAALFWQSLSTVVGGTEGTALGDELGVTAVSPLVEFFLTPVFLLGMLFVAAGVSHLLLSMFGGARHGFGTSVRVFCYAYSPAIFSAVPVLGSVVGSVWMVVLLIIGLREAHETDGWKAAAAVLLPVGLLLAATLTGLLLLALLTVAGTAGSLL